MLATSPRGQARNDHSALPIPVYSTLSDTSVDSIYGSTRNANAFNVRNGVYKQSQDVDASIDPRFSGLH